jgi:PKD repeat protein
VNPTPVSDFNVEGELIMTLPISFVNTSTGASTYKWDFGDGQTSDLENPTHTYSTYREYEITLTATNSFGCNHSSTETISIITGVSDESVFQIYPVPFNETLTMQSSWQATEWEIYDSMGRLYRKEKLTSHKADQINLSQLPPGVYFLRATNGLETVTRKLVKH